MELFKLYILKSAQFTDYSIINDELFKIEHLNQTLSDNK